jgi:hypothetical protein
MRVGVLLFVLLLCVGGAQASVSRQTLDWTLTPGQVQKAEKQLALLTVKAAGPMVTYERDNFGAPWQDTDHNRCDTRDDILRRDLTQIVYKPRSTCVVVSGTLRDPHTGETILFKRGPKTSGAVQIDHVVALGNAWRTGASTWTDARRLAYANDPTVLLAVDGPANEAKGDSDASEWLPANRRFDCACVARQLAVKAKYRLWPTKPEHDAISRVLRTCV